MGTRAEERLNLRNFTDAWKQAHGCYECGYDANPLGMELDHTYGRTEADDTNPIGQMRHPRTAWRAISARNVQVLCGTCHNIKSRLEHRVR